MRTRDASVSLGQHKNTRFNGGCMSLRPLLSRGRVRSPALPRLSRLRPSVFAFALLTFSPAGAPLAIAATPLSLDEALRLAVSQSPQLASQRALSEGASIAIVPAGELPDPKFKT